MKKILFVPLDERPCNRLYPEYMIKTRLDLELVQPPLEMLGHKKEKANISQIRQFVLENSQACDAMVLSLEMLFYGGLLPSRLHHEDTIYQQECLNYLRQIRQMNPEKPIYAFQLIMRTPRYSSNDEEPEYYGEYGHEIFRRAYLRDKQERDGLTEAEKIALEALNSNIPEAYIVDYETRRRYNLELNLAVLDLVKEGVIDFLAIPQDDSCEYGYTSMDQKQVSQKLTQLRLQRRVMMYPGADEAGSSLIARAVSELDGKRTKVYPYYASTLGPTLIPLYEDRIMQESLKSHLQVCRCEWVSSPEQAEFILAINCPGKVMQEASEQKQKDISYASFRNLNAFLDAMERYMQMGKKVVLADCAFANGGDMELIEMLDESHLLDHLYSYKGWNTHGNTLGTSIAQMVILNSDAVNTKAVIHNLMYHLIEDGFYQAIVRKETTDALRPPLNYFDLANQQKEVVRVEEKRLRELVHTTFPFSFKDHTIERLHVYHPWNRMFEIGMELWLS